MSKDLYIIDSFAVAFRSFYAFINNPLTTADGTPTSAVFGYANTIFRLLLERNVDYLTIAKDMGRENFRHAIYPEYKANRDEMPAELKKQLPILDEFMEISGIPVHGQFGFEADDIMASLCLEAEKKGFTSFMVTKDKDMMQIVNENIFMFQMEKAGVPHTVVDRDYVEKKFGVGPEHIRDLLALMGDAADNIPGVPKVGPKTAAKLLLANGSLEGIYQNTESLKGKLKENIVNNKDKALLSQELVTLKDDLDLEHTIEDLKFEGFDIDRMEVFLEKYELHSLKRHLKKIALLKNANQTITTEVETPKASFECIKVDTPEALEKMMVDLSKSDTIAVDTETSSLDTLSAKICGICLSASEHKGYYVVLNHKESKKILGSIARNALHKLFQDPSKTLVFHNAKFDLHILKNAKYKISAKIADTMLAAYSLEAGARNLSLDAQAFKYFKHEMIPITQLIGKGKNQISFAELSSEEVYFYSAEDAIFTYKLWEVLETKLKEAELITHYQNIEIPMTHVLQKMERRGISINSQALDSQAKILGKRINELHDSIYQHAGQIFNIGSPKQLAEILFEELGLPPSKKTKTGYSTDHSVLEKLKTEHPIIPAILETRELEKLKNTYVDVLPKLAHQTTNRIHTSYNQTIAATGRLSSVNPNLQNIPIRTKHGKQIRAAFVAKDQDHILLAADYSQIELRILAHLSQDENLCNAYKNGIDIHTQTAAAIYDCAVEEIDSDMRRSAKAINFGVIYGMSAFRLSNELEIPRARASAFIEGYFATYPKVTDFIEETVKKAHKDGFVDTLYGHRRYLPELDSDNGNIRNGAERMAVNTPIQGTAADLIKIAMIDVDQAIEKSDLDISMLLQVHDELIFEVPKSQVEPAKELIKKYMENAVVLDIPLVVDIGTGNTWLEAH
jgi:DNA polymerase-1